MRADKFEITGVSNMVRSDGTPIFNPEDSGKLRKIVEYVTLECPLCGTCGRIDDRGEAVCDDETCACVITSEDEPLQYPEDGFGGANADGVNRGASGHPLMRTPAMNDAGPVAGSKL